MSEHNPQRPNALSKVLRGPVGATAAFGGTLQWNGSGVKTGNHEGA